MRTFPLLLGGIFLIQGCSEPTLAAQDPAPTISILNPVADEQFDGDATIDFVATVNDNSALVDLEVTWSAAGAGTLGVVTPDSSGQVLLPVPASSLGEGLWAISAEVVDPAGQAGRDSVTIQVGEGVFGGDGAPNVVITGPTSGATFIRDDEIVILGTITDGDGDAPDTLQASLSASTVGILWEGNPSPTGTVSFPISTLPVGNHTVTLSALDSEGNVGLDSVDFTVNNDGRPYATILTPNTGDTFMLGDLITFEGEISDDEDDEELLTYEWTSDLELYPLDAGVPDSNGWTAFATMNMAAGSHLITFEATDTDGQWASDSILITLQDPNDLDQDGDGYTPNQNDCDDNDAAINPGEYDVCDDIDNNCDGVINEPWADSYETNETSATSYYLGTIDADLGPIFSASLDIAGLTLQHAQDEDWFFFYLDDDILDPAHPTVDIDVSAAGNYVIELYYVGGDYSDVYNFGGWTLKDSASGTGVFQVSGNGEPFSDDDDYWAVRVYSTSWTPGGCSDTYDLTISKT